MSQDPTAPQPGAAAPDVKRALVKLGVDLGPLVVFFLANAMSGIYAATAAFMAAFVVALAVGYALERKLAPMPLVSGIVVLAFGGLTIYLNDETFIKLKPTIVNGIFATVLLAGLAFGRPLIRYLLESVIELDDEGWRKLTVRWALFFIFLALLNELVWRTMSTDFWVGFKLWGVFPLTLAFAFLQAPLIERHRPKPPAPQGE